MDEDEMMMHDAYSWWGLGMWVWTLLGIVLLALLVIVIIRATKK